MAKGQPGTGGLSGLLSRAREAYRLGMWDEALRLAGSVLAVEPLNTEAFELVSSSRARIDLATSASGEHRLLTVLMCDVVGSTVLTQEIGPDRYKEYLVDLHRICVDSVTKFEGRVAQYRGDGVLAYFSYPQAHEDDAVRAVLAGLAIAQGTRALARDIADRDHIDFAVRVGIATGSVVLAEMGAGQWTTSDMVIGDSANLAARIQELAEPNGVVISDATKRLVEDWFVIRSVPGNRLKSYSDPVIVHHVDTEKQSGLLEQRLGTPFVGRTDEMGIIADAWATAESGGQRVIVISGEAGIGKTRLAAQSVNLVNARGGRSIELRCLSTARHSPFQPVITALRRLLALENEGPVTLEAVARQLLIVGGGAMPVDDADWVLAKLFGVDVPVDMQPEGIRERTLSVLSGLVGVVASANPFLLVVDDLQYADDSTLALISRVIESVKQNILVLATRRPNGPDLPGSTTVVVELEPLDASDCVALVESLLGAERSQESRMIAERSGGVPFFAEELARWCEEGGGPSPLPTAIDAVLTARLDRLDARARETASMMAVLGSVVERSTLHDVMAADSAEYLDRTLGALVGTGVIEADPTAPVDRYQFRHALIREAAYNRLLDSARVAHHGTCADVLAARAGRGEPVLPEIVAGHLFQAAREGEAVPWWGQAAIRAAASGAHTEAIVHFTAALAGIGKVPPSEERAVLELNLQLGLADSTLMINGYTAESVLLSYERADQLGATIGDRPEILGAIWGLQTYYLVRGQLTRSSELAHRARRVALATSDSSLLSTADAIVGYVEFFLGNLAQARTHLESGLTGHDVRVMPHDPQAASRSLLAICAWIMGELEAGEAYALSAHEGLAGLGGQRAEFTRAFVDCYLANYHLLRGDLVSGSQFAQDAWDTSNAHGFTQWIGASGLLSAALLCQGDQIDMGVTLLSFGIEEWRKAGAELMAPYFVGRLAEAMLKQGNASGAVTTYDEALSLAEQTAELFYAPELLRGRGSARLAAGDTDGAQADIEAAVVLARQQGALTFENWARDDIARIRAERVVPSMSPTPIGPEAGAAEST